MCLEYIALLSWTYSFPKTISDYTDLSICYLIRRDFPTRFTDYILKILFFLYELSSSNWKWGPATHLSKAGKEARLVERKVWWVGVGGERLSKGLLPPADNQWAGAVTHRGRGLHAEHSQLWQPSWNWSCSGLTSIILMVLGTVSLQFQGWFVPFPWGQVSKLWQLMSWLASQVVPVAKNLPVNARDVRDVGLIPGSGRSPGLGRSPWESPWTEEPGGLQSKGSQRVGHNWSDLTTLHTHHGYSLVIMELISSTCRGFQYLQDSSQDTAQNIVYSSWGGTKCFWLCLMTKLLLCGMWFPLTVFLCFCIFSLLWLNLFFDSGFSTNQRQAEDMAGKDHRVLLPSSRKNKTNQQN